MMMFKNIFVNILLIAATTFSLLPGLASCSDDNDAPVVLAGNGISDEQWADVNDADLKGEILIFEFTAAGAWTAVSDGDWCALITERGQAGASSLRIKVAENQEAYGRSATITLSVEGYSEPCSIVVRQGEGFLEKGTGTYREINNWVYGIMEKNYLWNDNMSSLLLDYSLDYQSFLTSVLDGIAGIDDANHDDGSWHDGTRRLYYSYIESNAPTSRAPGVPYTDSGMAIVPTILGYGDNAPCGFAVKWVTPGSPADIAGVRRGDFISVVNNIAVTESNYQNLGKSVLNGNVTIDLNIVEFNDGSPKVTNRVPSVMVGKDTYMDPAVYKYNVMEASDGKKVGYINIMGFHMDFDTDILSAFKYFRQQNINDLIIDLRFNTGGHVLSSTLLATLIAGPSHSDEVYVRTTYNKARTAAGEVGEYRIGNPVAPDAVNGYAPIADALGNALGMSRVFVICSNYTASASELLINGLRGLDITVNLVGTTTQGKNVGMEGWRKTWSNYQFNFYPITFYCENAKGFRDYADGFTPDVVLDDTNIYPGDFGTLSDYLTNAAFQWAYTGNKPAATTSSRGRSAAVRTLRMTEELQESLTRRTGGSIILRD